MKWLHTTIGKVCAATAQRDPSSNTNGTFRYVDIAGIDREAKTISRADPIPSSDAPSRARKVIKRGDVLVSTVRPNLNAVAQVPDELDDAIASTGFAVLRARPEVVDSRYLFYRVQHHEFVQFLTTRATGASYPAVTDGTVRSAPLPLPPISEQHRIVELLDEADHLRKLRREADAKAARILPALFRKLFGDPAANPKGWPVGNLGHLFDVVGGGTPSTGEQAFWNGEIPWVSPKDMKCDVILDTEDHITAEAIANSSTRLVTKGSILIVFRSGILAHTFPVAIAGRDVALNQDLKALNSRGEILNEYLYGWLKSGSRIALGCVKKGATVHNIDGARFLALKVAMPPRAIQETFARHLNVLLDLKKRGSEVSERVESLFNELLLRAFSADLTGKWREARMRTLIAEIEEQAKLLNFSLADEGLPVRT